MSMAGRVFIQERKGDLRMVSTDMQAVSRRRLGDILVDAVPTD